MIKIPVIPCKATCLAVCVRLKRAETFLQCLAKNNRSDFFFPLDQLRKNKQKKNVILREQGSSCPGNIWQYNGAI